ncbi:MAG: glycoside hydrolase family 25 protein [Rhizobiaceae bacterium]
MAYSSLFSRLSAAASIILLLASAAIGGSEFHKPWASDSRALVLDAYEFNEIDLTKISANKLVAGFINKGSDGMPPEYGCRSGGQPERELCKKEWRLYAVSKELFHTRRALAKALGLKWGAYHLGRQGNPIDQANHFIDFAEPEPDDLIAIDIEDLKSGKYISLEDAEEFARHIYRRLGRYPVLYINDDTAKHLGWQKDKYPLLSRLPLWYARYKPEVSKSFPKGNWDTYAMWQFASHLNCSANACPYRIEGAGSDIDINVANMSVKELKKAWPFGELVPAKDPKTDQDFSNMLVALARSQGSKVYAAAASFQMPQIPEHVTFALNKSCFTGLDVDPIITASIAFDRPRRSGRAD